MGHVTGTVRLAFRACAVHVRTARLVAVTVARRAGRTEDVVESVRQAVGEAFTLALRSAAPDCTLTMEIQDGDDALTICVWPVPGSSPGADALARAVLAGLTDRVGVQERNGQPVLVMGWDG